MEKYRKIDLFTLELGYALCDEEHLESILKPIVEIRENIFEKHGVAIHHVRVKDNSKLLPFEYVIKVSDCEVARFTLKKDSVLIIDTGSVTKKIKDLQLKNLPLAPLPFGSHLLKKMKQKPMVMSLLHTARL